MAQLIDLSVSDDASRPVRDGGGGGGGGCQTQKPNQERQLCPWFKPNCNILASSVHNLTQESALDMFR